MLSKKRIDYFKLIDFRLRLLKFLKSCIYTSKLNEYFFIIKYFKIILDS